MPFTTTVITGATSGIGKETAIELARKGHAIYMLVRDIAKGEEVKELIIELTKNRSIYVIECDLADLESVRNAANLLKVSLLAINVLINNAGGIFKDYEESKQGYEMTFAVNHLSHFVLVQHLMPLLQKGQARVINVSSEAHRTGKTRFKDMQWKTSPYSAYAAYSMAKLCNIYFTRSLAIKYGPKGITSFALHPGLVATGFGSELTGIGKFFMWLARPFMITAEQGAETTVFLATAPRLDAKSGQYFKKCKVSGVSSNAADEGSRNRLWELSTEMAGHYLGE
ncbi:SDR family oxidoreductase [Mucilaginibacter glaciei]|uniref:SDR family oxidoreductase n=1 Tax=Mucilaginibacter glaciei TaxID=2772109 RepID=A0A926NNK8_9SPHI|nr:SDR family oxidoreductase [Mucilaginibacter glaciei]MBD1391775.1 SDR family oxidoreductase [Mucilaginibacter glaciei]